MKNPFRNVRSACKGNKLPPIKPTQEYQVGQEIEPFTAGQRMLIGVAIREAVNEAIDRQVAPLQAIRDAQAQVQTNLAAEVGGKIEKLQEKHFVLEILRG